MPHLVPHRRANPVCDTSPHPSLAHHQPAPRRIGGPMRAHDWRQAWLDEYRCTMPSVVPYPSMPLHGLLSRAARRHPDHVACTLYGKATTYRQLDEQSRRLAASLARMGARPGRHVGLLMPNIPEYLMALQAVWLTGATALQLSPLMVAEEAGHWLEAAGCHLVVTLDLLAPVVMPSMRHGPVEHVVMASLARRMAMWRGMLYRVERLRRNGFFWVPDDDRRHRFETMLHAEPLDAPVEVDPAAAVAVLAPTGGTTASPKAVELTHANLIANAMQLRHWMEGDDATESLLAVLPFFHSYGLSVSLLTAWAACATMHLHPRFEARAVLDMMLAQKPTIVPAVPAMLTALCKVMGGKPADLSFVRAVISGASALTPEVREEFGRTGARGLIEGYGLTEASPVTHVNYPGERNRPGRIGVPLPDTEARIADPVDGAGELCVRGPQVMKGYFNNPLATEEALRDGWLHTGDIARVDEEGYYSLVDRKRDIIKTSGFLVFPAEVEEVLRSHPNVAEAAVVGVADLEKGEVVRALVVPRSGQKLEASALEAHCKLHLGKHKRPKSIEVVAELPKNFLGKVLRRKLRE
ncbi:MAG: AMP-binding protein [Gemmataceae bacterium]|nr:AMP-binding protein [Gemmataceae bacterium]